MTTTDTTRACPCAACEAAGAIGSRRRAYLRRRRAPLGCRRGWSCPPRRLAGSRLYLVLEARPHGSEPDALLDAALRGGVDVVQLRDKELRDDELVAAAAPFRRACDAHGALFVLNDRPDLVEACAADGVHVGQDDMPAAEARALVGPERLVGLSTHSRAEMEAADGVDYIGVGTIFVTPTKADDAVGLELVRIAAEAARVPWFAIGGIDLGNVELVAVAGARGVAVVRAIRDADGPRGGGAAAPRRAHAPRWVNHPAPEPSWKTTVFSPLSSTTSK